MGLDMYLHKVPQLSEKEILQLTERVMLADFEDKADEEIEKISKELGYKLPTQTFKFINKKGLQEAYDEKVGVFTNEEIRELLGWSRISIGEEVCYWRKFNALHSWFVENVQEGVDDCGKYEVTQDKLKELRDILIKVSKEKNDEVSEELFPTQSRFFFGSTEYDEYYYSNVENTLNKINEILNNELSDNFKLLYHSSW